MRKTDSLVPPPEDDKPGRTDDSGFKNMLSDVDHDIEGQEAEQEIIDRVPELKQLNENIEKATNNIQNSILQQESAIQQYQRAELNLGNAVSTISQKVDTINTHIDKVLENAPTQLKVSVKVNDADWQKIQGMFDNEHQWVKAQMLAHYQSINDMLADERKRAMEQFKEYDGIWFGRYGQWFFLFFFTVGIFVVIAVVVMLVMQGAGWTK